MFSTNLYGFYCVRRPQFACDLCERGRKEREMHLFVMYIQISFKVQTLHNMYKLLNCHSSIDGFQYSWNRQWGHMSIVLFISINFLGTISRCIRKYSVCVWVTMHFMKRKWHFCFRSLIFYVWVVFFRFVSFLILEFLWSVRCLPDTR